METPTCTVRVGVTGHRDLSKLTETAISQIRATVREVLTFLQRSTEHVVRSNRGYANRKPVFRIISPLAEGADRLVASEGLDLGFKLQCPLPANRDEYRLDFNAPSSKDTFDYLLSLASSVFELRGQRAGTWLEPVAYEAAGRVTLAQSDVLIAIWDGQQGEQGGTAQMVREAQQAGIPTIRIAPQNPTSIEFLSSAAGAGSDWRDNLGRALTSALSPPASAFDRVAEFQDEAFEETLEIDAIAKERGHADHMAGRYGGDYRRAFMAVYFLAPAAVLFAIAGWWLAGKKCHPCLEELSTWLELVCILLILSITSYGRREQWHERWLDARVLAEQFRTLEFLAPIAQTPPTSRLPPYVKAEQGDWTGWYFRARVRELGLKSAVLTLEYLADYQRQLLRVVMGQANHHRDKSAARKRTYDSLELATAVFFRSTFLICVAHLVWPHLLYLESVVSLTTLAAATAFLPALGAASEGLQAQGEYQRLSERSEGMCEYFTSLQNQLSAPELQPLSYVSLALLAHQASGVMLDELSDWRNLVRVRILHAV